MVSRWKNCYWGDIATLEYGKSCRTYSHQIGSYPVFGTNGQIGKHTEPLCHYPSVIIGRKGAYRGIHYSTKPFWVIDTAFYLKPIVELDLKWAYYNLLTQDINGMDSGSAIPSTSRQDFYALSVYLPPLPEQKAIAHILGSLDDKIELNQRMNRTLEAIARAIFKSWFIDFDPVRAKMEGRQPEGMSKEVADLFCDSFVDSQLGMIPKGWKVGTLGEEFNITMGQSPPGSTYNEVGEGLPFYQGRSDFSFRYPSLRVYCTVPTRCANAGDTLVTVRAPVGDINMATQRCCIGRGVASVRHKEKFRSYTYYCLRSLNIYFEKFEAEGTVFGSINKKDFSSIPYIISPKDLLKVFERLIYPIDERIENNEQVTKKITNIRDTLLPKLISGEIRVKEAEKTIEEVL
jgi:type I restriction enzyme S subunit